MAPEAMGRLCGLLAELLWRQKQWGASVGCLLSRALGSTSCSAPAAVDKFCMNSSAVGGSTRVGRSSDPALAKRLSEQRNPRRMAGIGGANVSEDEGLT